MASPVGPGLNTVAQVDSDASLALAVSLQEGEYRRGLPPPPPRLIRALPDGRVVLFRIARAPDRASIGPSEHVEIVEGADGRRIYVINVAALQADRIRAIWGASPLDLFSRV
jgi:hypothetical protein